MIGKHDQTSFEAIAQAYFGALADGNLARVPWAEDVLLRAPLAAKPLAGRREVEGYLGPLAGNLGEVQIRSMYISPSGDAMAVEAVVGPLHVLDKFVIRDGQIVEQQNFYDPRPVLEMTAPGELTADERAVLLQRLETSQENLRELLSSMSEQAAASRPASGDWTTLECAEHLVLTERALLQMVRQGVLQGPANPTLALELRAKEATVLAAMGDRRTKTKTFDFLQPRGKYAHLEAVLDAFLARRAETIEFARTTRAAVHHHAAPLEGFGLLDAYHLLLLIAAHTDRHLEQMRDAQGRGTASTAAAE
jgi:hypothetical protein